MKQQRAVVVTVAAAVLFLGARHAALAIVDCSDPNNCAEVLVGTEAAETLKPGDTFGMSLTFKQGPDNSAPGGIDEIAAIALTIGMPGEGTGAPLELNDCTLDAEGLPASVIPDPSISNFKVVVENASCAGGRTHCLCPDAGQTKDDFINIVIFGPNPLPTPGPGGIEIPTLPAGPQVLVRFELKVANGASGEIPLHVFNQVEDSAHPQFTAFLSLGDRLAVDQTCVPVEGQPPCSSEQDVSQVKVTNASVTVMGGCVGDCGGDSMVTVNEIITMVNIALGSADLSACPVGDANGDGMITVNEIIIAVNNALNGCP